MSSGSVRGRIGAVVRASWTMLVRDRAALLLSFAVPIVFFTIFALIFGSRGERGTARVALLVVDEDRSERSERLLTTLAAESALAVRRAPESEGETEVPAPYDRAAAEAAVRAGEAPVALVVPRGFGAASFAFGPASASTRARVELLVDPSDPVAPQVVQGLLQKAIFTGLDDLFLAGGLSELDRLAPFTPEQHARFDALLETVQSQRRDGPAPAGAAALPLAVEVHDVLGEERENPLIAFYAAGLGVMFLLFSAAGAGGALIEERESGTLDRLLATKLSMRTLLLGKLVYLTSLGVAQLALMFAWGWAVFGLDLRGRMLGVTAMALATALVSSSFGLVLAAASRTRKQLVAVSNLVILSISALGGSMFPRFLMPEGLKKASLVAFNSWALEGFLDILWRDTGLAAILPELGVLLLWTILFFAIARRIARKWEIV